MARGFADCAKLAVMTGLGAKSRPAQTGRSEACTTHGGGAVGPRRRSPGRPRRRRRTAPVGTGDLPSAVTDRDGTTHVVWLESNAGNTADTVTYCQIPRGSVDLRQHAAPGPGVRRREPQPRLCTAWVGGTLDGDSPKVMVSPFGDVYVVTHGTCPIAWGTSAGPLAFRARRLPRGRLSLDRLRRNLRN